MNESEILIDDLKVITDLVRSCETIHDDLLLFSNSTFDSAYERYAIFERIIRSYKVVLSQDISILFNKKQNYSLYRILNKSLNNYKLINWKVTLTKERIEELIDEFKKFENSKSLKKIKSVRDKYYSHRDKNAPSETRIELKEFEEFIVFAKSLVSELCWNLEKKNGCFQFKLYERKFVIK